MPEMYNLTFVYLKNIVCFILGFRIPDSGFRIPDSGFWFSFCSFRIPAFPFWALGLPFSRERLLLVNRLVFLKRRLISGDSPVAIEISRSESELKDPISRD